MSKVTTKIHLKPEMLAWLKEEAEKRHCSMAQIIRTAVLNEMAMEKQKNK